MEQEVSHPSPKPTNLIDSRVSLTAALFKQDCTDSVKLAIDCGFTHLDGAQVYGNEESLGAGIKAAGKPCSELYVVTKLNSGTGAADVKASLVESLQKLGTPLHE
jgi:diketogulonate reductase-like aldo/keto reductase